MNAREFIGRVAAWMRRDELDRDLERDLEAHVELLARDLEAEGMTPAEAHTAARRRVGNLTGLRERSREAWGFPALENVVQDIRYALRGLRRTPGFTLTAIVTLGLGIGANSAMFGIIDPLMFRPPTYMRAPGEVSRVYLETTYRGRTSASMVFPYRRYLDLQAAAGVGVFAAKTEWRFAVGTGDASRVRKVVGVSPSYFSLFDAPPALGRYFAADEDRTPQGALVAVISHALWTNEFAGADVRGRTLKVGVVDYTVIGVAPPAFVGTVAGRTPDVWVPVTTIPANMSEWTRNSYLRDYNWDWIEVIVRRAPGVDEATASQLLTPAYIRSRGLARAINPRVLPDSLVRPRAIAGPVKTAAGPGAGLESLVTVWVTGVAAIVLLIACANVANLMLTRAIRRRREISVRLALGARRSRLVAQFLTEGAVLALLGAAAGLFVAQWGSVAIRALLLPLGAPINLATDWRTLGVTLAAATIAALLTSLGPAFSATRADLASTIKSGERGGFQRSGMRAALLVAQAAMSVFLLVGAGLFVKSLSNARSVPLGYDARPVLEVTMDFRGFKMDSTEGAAVREKLLSAAQGIPGVKSAAGFNSRLFGTNTAWLKVDGIDSVEALGRFNFQVATPQYFDVMGTRILRGRGFTDADRAGAPLIAVVSESMARVLWPGRNAIGQCLRIGIGNLHAAADVPCTTVVGIAENTAQQNISDDPRYMYYLPGAQRLMLSSLLVRMSDVDAAPHMERVRRELNRSMPGDGFVFVRPLQEVVDDQSRSWRLGATMFVAFGGLALVVALVGLYGVISFNVAQRMRELGVRVALGARAGDIVGLVVGQGVGLGALGVAIGLGGAVLASRWVQPLLFRQSATDPVTYVFVGAAMLIAALAASAVPALRAANADPNAALRSE